MMLEHSPRTAMLLGAILSGGDIMELAKRMVEKDLTNSKDRVLLSNKGDEDERNS